MRGEAEGGSSGRREVPWLWGSHCRGRAPLPALAPGCSEVGTGRWVSLYLLSAIYSNCACTQLFLVPCSFFLFCCRKRCFSRRKHCSSVPGTLRGKSGREKQSGRARGARPGHEAAGRHRLLHCSPAQRPRGTWLRRPGPFVHQHAEQASCTAAPPPTAHFSLCLSSPHDAPCFSKMQRPQAASVFSNQISHT